ncbi:MAG: protein kinase [Isosphaerales bacterium]
MAMGDGGRSGAALLIGIGEYLHAERVWPLRYAARDAEALADVLIDSGVCGFPAPRVKLLTNADAGRDAVAHHLSKWLPEQAKGAEIAVIYFAGHGMVQAVGRREEGFLLPYDADPEDLVTRGVLMADLARWIEGIDAGAVVVCLDCCHAAKLIPRGGNAAKAGARDMRIRPALFQELTGRGRFLIASCDDGQVSVEAETWGHGLFTHHLLEGIRGAGDRDGDGRVGVAELFEYVAEAVERDARAMGTMQKPWNCSIGPGGVFLSAPLSTLSSTPYEGNKRIDDVGDAACSCEQDLDGEPVDALIARLDAIRRSRDPAGIPAIFGGLVHGSNKVREQAKVAARALGWERTSAAILDLARQGVANQVRTVLEGLAAFESHRDVVALLDRLVNLLKGDLRNQAILMLERKRLVLEMEKTVAVFRAIHSPYRISRVLGQGLFTSAYAARDEEDELDVVVRVLRPEFAGQPLIRAKFLDLSYQARRFVHQNLVLTREVRAFPEHELYFVVRDHVDGVTLQSLIDVGTTFPGWRIRAILIQIVAALRPLHRAGMAHGGVKPSNVFLLNDDQVKLGDPTLPVSALGASLERLSYDYRYAAPELFQGSGATGPAADLYALGCITYELACGRPPFVADNPFELASLHLHRPPSLEGNRLGRAGEALLLNLLAKSPADRCTGTDEVARALQCLADLGETIPDAAPEALPDRFSSALRHEEAVSIVSFNPNTIAPSLSSIPPRVQSSQEPVPQRLGRYQIIEKLGQGGMGSVYRARDVSLDRVVALKVMEGMGRTDGRAFARFQVEARAAAQLSHPGIVQIHDVGEQDGVVFLTLQYVGGGSLSQVLRREGPMAPDRAAHLVLEMARAVHAAHERGIIHRDLKPGNILLTEAGTPMISDFGLAKLLDPIGQDEEGVTRTGELMGTPAYMSPEQVRGEPGSIGPATDVYGLGTILYECLTGRRPFQGVSVVSVLRQVDAQAPASPRQIRPEVPVSLERICLKCLEKRAERRYSTAAELVDDLERFLADEPVLARPPDFWDRLRRLFSLRKPPRQPHRPSR